MPPLLPPFSRALLPSGNSRHPLRGAHYCPRVSAALRLRPVLGAPLAPARVLPPHASARAAWAPRGGGGLRRSGHRGLLCASGPPLLPQAGGSWRREHGAGLSRSCPGSGRTRGGSSGPRSAPWEAAPDPGHAPTAGAVSPRGPWGRSCESGTSARKRPPEPTRGGSRASLHGDPQAAGSRSQSIRTGVSSPLKASFPGLLLEGTTSSSGAQRAPAKTQVTSRPPASCIFPSGPALPPSALRSCQQGKAQDSPCVGGSEGEWGSGDLGRKKSQCS